ncbi:hypothetical protein [Meiothermus sp.]|jgi:hypothetical protein|uniref:hypothetical protein n=1 Tax=Meiothermus sp. TaxID=1955249 RepID=UPI0021DD5882|nr:hypothetical protein [Meiothermus sp.]GIW24828.1 MAG: hypothetical protein KatS3mg069_1095 [Meiothermus sp.]
MARLIIFVLLLLGPALAQNLLALAPQGALAGFYINDLRSSLYLKGLANDWKQSGLQDLLSREFKQQAGSDAALLGIAAGGVAVALYSDGFFAIARPSAEALQALRKETKGLRPQGGWLVGGDQDVQTGFSRELVFLASPKYTRLFLQNRRGLQAPVKGDIVLWGAPPQDLLQSLNLPPRANGAARALRRFSYAIQLTAGGYTEETRLEVNPAPDPALASLLLPKERPYNAADLPQGYSVSTGVLDLSRLGAYLPGLLREFDVRLNLDLRAFGARFATVTVQGPPPAPDGRSEAILGHNLIYWEVRDPATAEANLLAILQSLAAFSTPDGQGGFKVLGNEGDFKVVEVGLGGTLYYKLEPTRLVIATSKSALQASKNPPWRNNPDFQRFRARIPANAVGYTFSNQGALLREQFGSLSAILPQTIGNQTSPLERDLSNSLVNFLERVAKRFGVGLSYAVVEGNSLVSRGFYEVRW